MPPSKITSSTGVGSFVFAVPMTNSNTRLANRPLVREA